MKILLSHLFCVVPLIQSQAVPEVPGIAAWQAAIQQHAQAEEKVIPKKEGEVPGLASWEAQQRAVLEAERRLEQGGKKGVKIQTPSKGEAIQQSRPAKDVPGLAAWEAHQKAIKVAEKKLEEGGKIHQLEKKKEKGKQNTGSSSSQAKPGVAEGFKDIIKLNKLLSKLSGKSAGKGSAGNQLKSKVESLLERSRETKKKEQPREESFLDKLIKTYSDEERETALSSVGNDKDVLQSYKSKYSRNNRKDRQRELRQKKYRDGFSFLYDYDYELPP